MSRNRRYPPEVRERAVALVLEHQGEHPSQWAAMGAIAPKFGMSTETLRSWVRQAERRVVPPLIRVAAPGIDQVAAREEQLLELLEAPVGDQDRSLAHGEVVLQGRVDIRAWA